MHEASFIIGLLDTVTTICARDGYNKVNSIRLRIGKGSSIKAEALEFAFEVCRQGTVANNASLVIETIPLGGTCNECDHTFTLEPDCSSCPACHSQFFVINQGFDLEILDMDVAEP